MKRNIVKVLLACGAAAAPVTTGALAFAQAPAPSPAMNSPTYISQLTETHGTVQRFILTPIGEIDGVILADATEIHLPPHLTAQIANGVRAGDTVVVEGFRSSWVPLVVASSITDTNGGQTIVDNGPPPPGSRPPPLPPGLPAPGAQQTRVEGKVQMPLYGPAGDVSGALLDDGTIVRTGPRDANQLSTLLSPGQPLAVQEWGLTTAYDRVVEIQAAGPTTGQMVQVAPPSPAYGPADTPPR